MTRSRRPPGAQRGAAAVTAAFFTVLAVTAIGVVVNLGTLYYLQRDLQRMANLAAMDAAMVSGGCLGLQADPAATALAEAQQSVLRNGGQSGWVSSAEVGRKDTVGGINQFTAVDNPSARAVRISLTRPPPTFFFPLFGGGNNLSATAAALSTPKARVSAGAMLADLSPGDESPLNDLFTPLGGAPGLSLGSYQGLVGANVPVLDLLERLPGSPEVPPTGPTPVEGLLQALSDLLDENGDSVAADAAQVLADLADTSRTVDLSQVFGDEEPAADALVSAATLVRAVAQNSLAGTVMSLGISFPPPIGNSETLGLAGSPATLDELVPGGVSVDPDNYARNTQINLNSAELPISLPGITGVGQLQYFVQAGQATAEIENIACARSGQPFDTADVYASSSLTRIGIGYFPDINAPDPEPEPITVVDSNATLSVLSGLGLPVSVPIHVRITASAFVNVGDAESTSFPGMTEGETRRLGTPSTTALAVALAEIPSALVITPEITVLGSPSPLLAGVISDATALLSTSLRDAVQDAIENDVLPALSSTLGPQLEAQGLTLGGADIRVESISANQPELFLR